MLGLTNPNLRAQQIFVIVVIQLFYVTFIMNQGDITVVCKNGTLEMISQISDFILGNQNQSVCQSFLNFVSATQGFLVKTIYPILITKARPNLSLIYISQDITQKQRKNFENFGKLYFVLDACCIQHILTNFISLKIEKYILYSMEIFEIRQRSIKMESSPRAQPENFPRWGGTIYNNNNNNYLMFTALINIQYTILGTT
eukprot:TRINITY_DN9046_c0_g1_i1.p3 TRINITY_DN9046_c0_g1~~TRINITY_DN9046_c0_g1_i1.p3  ORF type:complete len:200 (+),score=-6.04 TRINITY_DN9046_c0_g1_i1:686-1285(+)